MKLKKILISLVGGVILGAGTAAAEERTSLERIVFETRVGYSQSVGWNSANKNYKIKGYTFRAGMLLSRKSAPYRAV